MIFRRFLAVAQRLARGSDEADWRSAISRAYYAAFHVGRDLLQQLGFNPPRSEAAHAYVWLRLSNSGDTEAVKAGRGLNDLRGERNDADYREKPKVIQTRAEDVVRLAEEVISILDKAAKEPKRSEILKAMKAYEKDVLKEVTWRR
jgi:uncharacterized protein (UPF0332 family)